jgi:gliding motility-associated-like protein
LLCNTATMNSRVQLFLCFIIFWCFPIYSQTEIPGAHRINVGKDSISNENWSFLQQYSNAYSSRLVSDQGTIATIVGSRPINYLKNGSWQQIDPKLRQNPNGWLAADQPNQLLVSNQGEVFFKANSNSPFGFRTGMIGLSNSSFSEDPVFSSEENSVEFFYGQVKKKIYVFENAVKYHYEIDEWTEGALSISEEIELMKGSIYRIENGELIINDLDQETLARFSVPIVIDAHGAFTQGKYQVKKVEDRLTLSITVDESWILDPLRAFPVIIDPIVTGPTSNWTGGNMPSCIMPAYNRDSILVTIPGGVMVTGLFVTGSFYADPFTTATMGQGEMKYSTNCGASQGFIVTGANSSFPGTAYLDSVNILNPLTCCFPETCSDTSFWLTMMLGRTGPGTGCNTSYIRYDAATTLWPFKAVIVGKTVESYGSQWNVIQTSICSNTCELTALAYAMNGVPPYTFSHPWSDEIVTQGQSIGCGNGANNHQFTLTIPNCPIYCDSNFTSLVVPPAVITDACGNTITGMPSETITIKPAPHVSFNGNTNLCSGEETSILLDACLTGALAYWEGNGTNGVGGIYQVMSNQSGTTDSTQFIAYSSLNNCQSDTTLITVYNSPVQPALYSWNPNPAIVSESIQFSSGTGGDIISWEWTIDGTTVSGQPQFEIIENNPGEYEVCLIVTSYPNCPDTLCKMVTIAPATVLAPNIITSNGDGVNDLVAFRYLEFYPNNRVSILNRWGNPVFQEEGYQNDWDPRDLTEGVYFYHVIINDGEQELQGFFHLEKE